ncbi:MAG: glycosyltransferase family 4 protein [Saprospiraceae bacterium]|nr:glycosyltransferase family 4 protein [Saprospiraceae bacterium]
MEDFKELHNITIVNQVCGPMCIDIANAFQKSGFRTVLITGEVQPASIMLHEDIIIYRGIKYKRNKPLTRILTWCYFTLQVVFLVLFRQQKGRLLLVTNPPLIPFFGYFFKKLFQRSYDVIVYDIYPNVLVNGGYLSTRSIIFRIWAHLNVKALRAADRVFTLSERMRDTLTTKDESSKIEVVPCWVDTNGIKPIIPKEDNWFASKYAQTGKFTVLYSGNMGESHDLKSILKAALDLKGDSKIHFLLIGEGTKKRRVEKYVEAHHLENVTILPFQDASVLPYSLACGDIGIVTTSPGMGHLLVPSKTFYYLAGGNYVLSISDPNSELEELFKESEVGKNITHAEKWQLSSYIKDLCDRSCNEQKERSFEEALQYGPDLAFHFI